MDDITQRIKGIENDWVSDGGMVAQLIEDNPINIFPQFLTTERPDFLNFSHPRMIIISDRP
ncbi:hypothetical protein PWYN_28215 [Paenibacillus wynnii]|uniref:Uncharacterized protein n=1 Tax=Paenibacillus wynnii TaxID=268407 RepID=A0A098M789_9BACL|nr:spore germination protein [Paenibacillus wynnii]KGE18395.1 hypothetical protein PWYN_28215 [Paenibacillus wynnii]